MNKTEAFAIEVATSIGRDFAKHCAEYKLSGFYAGIPSPQATESRDQRMCDVLAGRNKAWGAAYDAKCKEAAMRKEWERMVDENKELRETLAKSEDRCAVLHEELRIAHETIAALERKFDALERGFRSMRCALTSNLDYVSGILGD